VIFQYEYTRRDSVVSVDVFADNDPKTLDFSETMVFGEAAFMAFKDLLLLVEEWTGDEIFFVDLDKS